MPPIPPPNLPEYTQGDLYIIEAIEAFALQNTTDLSTLETKIDATNSRLDDIETKIDATNTRLDTAIARLDTEILRLIDIIAKLEEIRVFHERYISERRLPRQSAATLLLSEYYGNEDLDDDADGAIYGKDFVLDPEAENTPQLFKVIAEGIVSEAPTKTWEEYLDTIEEESFHP